MHFRLEWRTAQDETAAVTRPPIPDALLNTVNEKVSKHGHRYSSKVQSTHDEPIAMVTGVPASLARTPSNALFVMVGPLLNVDLLTYAGNLANLADCCDLPEHVVRAGDIRDGALVASLLEKHRPSVVFNIAAESHLIGRLMMLLAQRNERHRDLQHARLCAGYWRSLPKDERAGFKIIQCRPTKCR